jgi:RND family efflux transporter MFP subunit
MRKQASGVAGLSDDLDRLRSDESELGRPPKKRRRLRAALVLLALIGAGYLLPDRFSPARLLPAGLGAAPTRVSVVPVVRREVGLPPVVLSAVGYVVPEREITISASVQGKLVEMPVAENDRVRAGQLLARLESRDEQANLQLVRTERADASRELELARELFALGVRTRTDLERAQTVFDRAEARLVLARTALDNTVLVAPFDGTIVRKLRDVGELLTLGVTAQGDPGTAIVTLADLDPLHVALEINEAEIRKLREGMVALVTPEARPDRRYLGDLVEIAARADRNKGVVAARVRIRGGEDGLLPNMTVSVRFMSTAPRGEIASWPSIPRSALVRRDGRDVVFVVEDERVRPVRVVTAAAAPSLDSAFAAAASDSDSAREFVALREGPEEGAYVVDSPPSTLREGSPVRTGP